MNLFFASTFAWCWAVGRSEPRVGALAAIGALFKLFPSVLVLWPTGEARRRSIVIAADGVEFDGSLARDGGAAGLASFPGGRVQCPALLLRRPGYVPCALTPMVGPLAAKAIAVGVALIALAAALRVRNDRAAFVLFGVAMLAPVSDMHFNYWLIAYVAVVVLVGGALRRAGIHSMTTVVRRDQAAWPRL